MVFHILIVLHANDYTLRSYPVPLIRIALGPLYVEYWRMAVVVHVSAPCGPRGKLTGNIRYPQECCEMSLW